MLFHYFLGTSTESLCILFLHCIASWSVNRAPRSPARLTSRKQVVLVAQELAAVGLAEDDDASRVEAARLRGAAGGDAEAEGRVVHVVDDDALVLGAVLGPAADVGLDDVAAVEEGHLAVALDPDLPASVLAEDGQGGDVQAELARLGKLAC